MAFFNNQWLDGTPLRNRKHQPVDVKVSTNVVDNPWDKEHHVKGVLRLTRDNGDYQLLLLTNEDLSRMAPLFRKVPPDVQWELLKVAFGDHVELLGFLRATMNLLQHSRAG